jgi:NAD-dependent DNA ligase
VNEPKPSLLKMIAQTQAAIELQVMVHRYLYYVKCSPVIGDRTYDELERVARDHLPASSPVHQPGSDLASSYTAEQIEYAERLLKGLKDSEEFI